MKTVKFLVGIVMAAGATTALAQGCGDKSKAAAPAHTVALDPTKDMMDKAKKDGKDAADKMVDKALKGATSTQDIVTLAAANPQFSTLVDLVQKAGLVETLKGKGPFTVFAPTNDAFRKIDARTLEALGKDKAALTTILTYHVVPASVTAADVTKLTFADTVSGQRAGISTKDGVVIAGAKVTKTDLIASNGVIHVVDTVMMPSLKNVVQVAGEAGQFKTLARLLDAAGLVSTLEGPGPFTVFAPTDAAFAKLPKETVDSLLKPENKDQLAKILTYHVVPGRVFSNQALEAKTAKTVQGQTIEIAVKDGKAMVNNANLVTTDINASNGVIHVIDTVIMPK